jgi:DNA-binding response OmpR family regulator
MTKILVADDSPFVLEIVETVLKSEGFDVITAVDGLDAWNKIQKDKPDIVIVDIIMPGLNGYQICEKIKKNEELKNTPVLVLTTKAQDKDIELAQTSGADLYMTKPFDPDELAAKIRRFFEKKK